VTVVAFVPAKGESERIPSKNIRILDGEYLFRRKLRQLLHCPLIDEVWLDTDSEEIINLSSDLPIHILRRDPALASNATDGHALFENECRHVPHADIIVQALCTAPFIDEQVITRALEQLISSPSSDSLVAVREAKLYTWAHGSPLYGYARIPNSSELPTTTIEAMSLYAMRSSSADFPVKRFGRNPTFYELNARESIDINHAEDLELAEMVCRGERMREANYFRILKNHLSSAVLSDVTKEMGFELMADPVIQPVSNGKILGRVRTLKLGPLNDVERTAQYPEAWKGIYKALDSYSFVRSGDVIVVENLVPERAYFGDLNCHIAMRAGAVGALVDGFTRDVEGVRAMGFPVYARGAWSNDIKYEGKVISYNLPVHLGGVTAHNDDVVFADLEGILIVPSKHWKNVLGAALEIIEKERDIRQALLSGRNLEEVVNELGTF
jgi:regulator of RNase E activity RraA/CMP-N-acetylneuraminic acid synthetase